MLMVMCSYGEATAPPLVEACVKTFGTDAKCVVSNSIKTCKIIDVDLIVVLG